MKYFGLVLLCGMAFGQEIITGDPYCPFGWWHVNPNIKPVGDDMSGIIQDDIVAWCEEAPVQLAELPDQIEEQASQVTVIAGFDSLTMSRNIQLPLVVCKAKCVEMAEN